MGLLFMGVEAVSGVRRAIATFLTPPTDAILDRSIGICPQQTGPI
jgi:hypothetical protein